MSDHKYFCCTGCRTVFEILNENDLTDYYDYEKTPGLSMRNQENEKFRFLENAEIANSILDFSSDDLARVTLYIPDIHCSSCIWLLENLYKLNQAVKDSRVDFLRKEASITFYTNDISLKELAEMLDSLGYGPLINWDSKNKKERKRSFGPLQIKLGVAGFCFGNIMLMSFPEYFGLKLDDDGFASFFSIFNMLLAVPVLLYSGVDYLKSAYKGIINKVVNIDVPIALGIVALFTRSVYEVVTSIGPGYFDSFAGLIFFLLIGRWFQDRTYENLSFERDYKSYFPLAISRFKGSETEVVPVQELKNGDIVKIRNNEIIPADCILLSADTKIDYSFVTGEQVPVNKQKGDLIYAGGRQRGRDIRLEVKKPVAQSYLTSLWNNDSSEVMMSQRIIDRVAKYFTYSVLLIALVTSIYWSFVATSAIWETITAVLIVACPCALALSVPFTYGTVLRVAGKNLLYLKSASVVEKFQKNDRIIFDKTGTLTWPEQGNLSYSGKTLSTEQLKSIKALASASFHPLSSKLSNSIHVGTELPQLEDFEELPGLGISATVLGKQIKLGSLAYTGGTLDDAGEKSLVGVNFSAEFLGRFEIETEFRHGFEDVISRLSNDYRLGILSGDKPFDMEYLKQVFPEKSIIKFEQNPDEKKKVIDSLSQDGERVIMFGDGLNDGVALSSSNVGVAITDDISAFSPACDAIYSGKQFSKLPDLLKFFRNSRKIVIASFVISFLYNVVGLSFAVTGNLTPIFAAILMPISSLSILIFATLTVNLSARLNHL